MADDRPEATVRQSFLATVLTLRAWVYAALVPLGVGVAAGGVELLTDGSPLRTYGPAAVFLAVGVALAVVYRRYASANLALITLAAGATGAVAVRTLPGLSEGVVAGLSTAETVGLVAVVCGAVPWFVLAVLYGTTGRFRLYADRFVYDAAVPRLQAAPIPYDDVEVVIRRSTPSEELVGAANYELVLDERENAWFPAVGDPERFEQVLTERVVAPADQRRRADRDTNLFWHLWPEDCPEPDEPVVEAADVEETLGVEFEGVDLNDLDAAVETDGFDDLGDIDHVDVGGGFDGAEAGDHGGDPDADGDFDGGDLDGGGGFDGGFDF